MVCHHPDGECYLLIPGPFGQRQQDLPTCLCHTEDLILVVADVDIWLEFVPYLFVITTSKCPNVNKIQCKSLSEDNYHEAPIRKLESNYLIVSKFPPSLQISLVERVIAASTFSSWSLAWDLAWGGGDRTMKPLPSFTRAKFLMADSSRHQE